LLKTEQDGDGRPPSGKRVHCIGVSLLEGSCV